MNDKMKRAMAMGMAVLLVLALLFSLIPPLFF